MHFIDLDSDMDGAGDLLRMMGEGEWGLWLTWAGGGVGSGVGVDMSGIRRRGPVTFWSPPRVLAS